ncbi:prolyl-tRNA synthetase associated domain-containing protein [Brucellaceae bacterium C25G]
MHKPLDPAGLFEYLDNLGVKHSTITHPPLFTVAESQAHRLETNGAHTKNLFVKDKKGKIFLLTVGDNAVVDLKQIHHLIGASGRVSFCKAEQLMELLGVIPGSVTVLGAVNDRDLQVQVVLDESLMQNEIINAHPLTNEATTSISREDLLIFLRATGHEPLIVKLSADQGSVETGSSY